MTLLEMKKKVLALIEETSQTESELTDDPDIKEKINDVINQVQFELARIKKIPAREKRKITEESLELDLDTLEDFYQLERIRFENEEGEDSSFEIFVKVVEFKEPGTATIYYYKYPKSITADTEDDYIFELSGDVLEIMPYGVAADILKSDVSNGYGQIYNQRYEQMLQRLDPRYSTGFIYIDQGVMI